MRMARTGPGAVKILRGFRLREVRAAVMFPSYCFGDL